MSESCKWIVKQLETLPFVKFPFDSQMLPNNGIYFFFENGENWGHGGNNPRIVRIGTHKDGNFQNRIKEHFIINDSKMNFTALQSPPHDRSIFRKNIGRALLNKENDGYLRIWEIDFTSRKNRDKYAHLRNIKKEKDIEFEVTKILRQNFSFKFVIMDNEFSRMGKNGLESSLIGTVAQCKQCKSSNNWLGNYSPKNQIIESGLWLIQHLKSNKITKNLPTILPSIP